MLKGSSICSIFLIAVTFPSTPMRKPWWNEIDYTRRQVWSILPTLPLLLLTACTAHCSFSGEWMQLGARVVEHSRVERQGKGVLGGGVSRSGRWQKPQAPATVPPEGMLTPAPVPGFRSSFSPEFSKWFLHHIPFCKILPYVQFWIENYHDNYRRCYFNILKHYCTKDCNQDLFLPSSLSCCSLLCSLKWSIWQSADPQEQWGAVAQL